jgi:hypothetical protein
VLIWFLQISTLNVQLADAESLTQDVMRDLHSVKLDISNYAVRASLLSIPQPNSSFDNLLTGSYFSYIIVVVMQSLVSQQQLELISERARHFDEAQEKVVFPSLVSVLSEDIQADNLDQTLMAKTFIGAG